MKQLDAEYIKKLMEFWEDLTKTVNAAIADKRAFGPKWTDEDDEMWELMRDLNRFLVRWFDPADVSDIRALPVDLQQEAVVFLIERDAADAYDQIDGFLDLVILDGLDPRILESCRPTDNGLQICEWISRNIAEKAETGDQPWNDDDDYKLDRKGGSPMTPSEKRISNLEDDAFNNSEHEDNFRIVLALCEIARQLARIADTLQFELAWDDETIRRFAAGRNPSQTQAQERKP